MLLGFAIGILVFLFVSAVLSYQIEHCGQIEQPRDAAPQAQPQRPVSLQDSENRNGKESQYDDKHPIACGVIGFPRAVRISGYR